MEYPTPRLRSIRPLCYSLYVINVLPAAVLAQSGGEHGFAVFESCAVACVGETTDCTITVAHLDDYEDAQVITEVWDEVQTAEGWVRVPANGSLPIDRVLGNAVCTDDGGPCDPTTGTNCALPCYLGQAESIVQGLPGFPGSGRVVFRQSEYMITPDDPRRLSSNARVVLQDMCDAGDTACPTHIITGQTGSTTTVPDCDDGDACTLDLCSDGGCYHEDIVCPESSHYCDGPPSCDPAVGCVLEDPPCVSDGFACDEITAACVHPGEIILIDLLGSSGIEVLESGHPINIHLDNPFYSVDDVAITMSGMLQAGEVDCRGDLQPLAGNVCVMVGDDYGNRVCSPTGYPDNTGDWGTFEHTTSMDALLAELQTGNADMSFWVESWTSKCYVLSLPSATLDRATIRILGQPMFDANVDGKVDSSDALFSLDCMDGSAMVSGVECGIFDADGDRDVDLRDVAALFRIVGDG
jgi:hypothetical protein